MGGTVMIQGKLPKSFRKLSNDELYKIVEEFISLNKNIIKKSDIDRWYEESEYYPFVPALFITFVKNKGFQFSQLYREHVYYAHDLTSLRKLISREERELIKQRKKLMFENLKKELALKPELPPKKIVHTCFNDSCIYNNTDKCSSSPTYPIDRIDGIIVDCNRFINKKFRFRTWNEVLDISPER
jgi:hypothetical protein